MSSSVDPPPPEPGEVFGLQRQDALRRLAAQDQRLFDEVSCDGDNQCVATRFRGCCADYFDGNCEWRAISELWLQRALEACTEEECPDAASPCLQQSTADAPEAYCAVYEDADLVSAVCSLRAP